MIAELKAVAGELRHAERILLASHRSPEGDALGSSLGLALALRSIGKSVTLFNTDPVPADLHFLPFDGLLTDRVPDTQFDAAIICDVTEPERVADDFVQSVNTARWLILDHHRTERDFGDVRCNDPEAPATSELVLHVLDELGIDLSPEVALCLYTGLAVDTGNFRFSNATARAFDAALRCVKAGVDASQVAHFLFEERPLAQMRLTARALDSLTVSAEGSIAWIVVSDELLRQCHASPQQLDGLVNYPRALKGCRVAAQFFARDDGDVRVSLRTSEDAVDVESVARRFGGGGHKHAAGCTLQGPLDEAVKRLVAEANRMLAELDP